MSWPGAATGQPEARPAARGRLRGACPSAFAECARGGTGRTGSAWGSTGTFGPRPPSARFAS
eukprot:9006892-Heterocapsa_arctica.AAC.1